MSLSSGTRLRPYEIEAPIGAGGMGEVYRAKDTRLDRTRAFEGKSQASLIAAILAAEPKPLRTLQPLAPLVLERVVQTCLAKDPEERWQNVRDIKSELEWIADAKTAPEETTKR